MHRALVHANQRKHEYATLEHLLLALIDDADAFAVMNACKCDFVSLKENLVGYLDNGLKRLIVDDGPNSKPTAAFQRVVQRAGLQAKELNRHMVTGADALVAIFAETASPAARILGEYGLSHANVAKLLA
jgi:ATP-dependent Clp protease ATP-binding subunit ClpA